MIIRHPTLPVAKDVPDAAVSQWEAAGWLVDRPAVELPTNPPGVEDGDYKPARRRASRTE